MSADPIFNIGITLMWVGMIVMFLLGFIWSYIFRDVKNAKPGDQKPIRTSRLTNVILIISILVAVVGAAIGIYSNLLIYLK